MTQLWKTSCRLCGASNMAAESLVSLKVHLEIGQKIVKYLSIHDLQDSNYPDGICLECYKMLSEFDIFAVRCERAQTTFREIISLRINYNDSKADIHNGDQTTVDRNALENNISLVEVEDLRNHDYNFKTGNSISLQEKKLNYLNVDEITSPFKDEIFSDKSDDQFSDIEFKSFEYEPIIKVRKRRKKRISLGKINKNEKPPENIKHTLQEIVKQDVNMKLKLETHETSVTDAKEGDVIVDGFDPLKKKAKVTSCLKYDCHICNEDCRNWHALCIHFRDVHNARAKVLCVCGKFLASRVSIGRHCAKHGKADSFNCPLCDKRFPRASELEAHQVSHLPIEQRPYVCCKCARRFTSSQLLRHHERMHIPINQRMLHPCNLCDTKFATKSGLTMHIRAVHERLRPFVCDQCGRAFTTKGILEEHQVRHSDARPHKCDICGKCFKTKQRLAIHADTHGNTVYQCPRCPVKLNSRRTLRMHLFVHDDICRYRCSFCDKAFKRAKDLKNHHNLHTGRRPYSCPWCSRTFANGSNCRAHKRRMHPLELETQKTETDLYDGNTNIGSAGTQPEVERPDSKLTAVDEPKVIYTTVKRKTPLRPIIQPNFLFPPDFTEKDTKSIAEKEVSPNPKLSLAEFKKVKVEDTKEEVPCFNSDKTTESHSNLDTYVAENDHQNYLDFQSGELSVTAVMKNDSDERSRAGSGCRDNESDEESLHVPIIMSSFSKSPPQGCPFIQNPANQSIFLSSNSYFSRHADTP